MKYKNVPRIKEPVSAIGLGCWGFSGAKWWGERSEEKNSIRTIRTALDIGINFLDVAPVYGQGTAEMVVGKAIKGYARDQFIIATKCGLLWDDTGKEWPDLTKKSILKEIDDSLRRLDVDYVDIYQLHWPDPCTPLEETMEAIKTMMDAGKIRYFGVTNFAIDDVAFVDQIVPVASQQALYNMLERNPKKYHHIDLVYQTEREIFPYCLEHGQAFLPYSPLMQGLLTGTWPADKTFGKDDVRRFNLKLAGENYQLYYKAMTELKKVAEKYGHNLYETAVNWLIQKPVVTSVIGSSMTPEEVRNSVKTLEWEICDEMMVELNKIIEPFENL